MIQINPESLQLMCNRIDQWAENLKQTVAEQGSQEVAQCEGMAGFEGQAAVAYREKFHELTMEINRAIEQISDQMLHGMRNQLESIGRIFEDADGQIASNLHT
jgi:WXG100 family type VII secretion target